MSGNVFTIGQRVLPPASLANVGALALSSLLARIALKQVAAFFAVACEPLVVFPGVILLACVWARARANFLRALIFLQRGFRTKKAITHQMIRGFTTLTRDAFSPDGGRVENCCVQRRVNGVEACRGI